jgi:hypothetical protein
MKRLLLFVSMWSWTLAGLVNAQGHDAHWIFGMGYHMEFVDGDVVMHPRIEGYMAREGASCISDKDGNLLFYSNTQRIWNRQHLPLWNGDSINTLDVPSFGSSITNGSLFLPWPGDTLDRFFAFIVRGELDQRLFLSRIDKNLDGGNGGIESVVKNIPITNFEVGEQLTAVRHGNGRDWWVLFRKQLVGSSQTGAFGAVCITSRGIVDAGFSGTGIFGNVGEMVISPDGRLAALASRYGDTWIGLFSFDRCTGQFSLLDTNGYQLPNEGFYGIAFNKNGDEIYVSSLPSHTLFRVTFSDFVLSADSVFRLEEGSATMSNFMGQLELGPDGKVYVVMATQFALTPTWIPGFDGYLGSVESDFYDTFAIALPDTVNRTLSLPHFPNYTLGALVGSPCDSLSPPVDTSTAVVAPAPAAWAVHPTVGRGAFVVRGLPLGVTVEAYDAFGRKAGAWRMDGDPLLVSGADWAAGPYWLVAVAVDGRRLGTRRVLRLGE